MSRSFEDKIVSIQDLLNDTSGEWEQALRPTAETRVLTFGVFDMLHVGHVYYLEAAKCLGKQLIVGIDSDARVKDSKGFGRPIFKQEERLAIVAALECVDSALIFDDMKQLIDAVSPNIMVTSPTSTKDPAFDKLAYADSRNIRVESIPPRSDMHTSDYLLRIGALFQLGRQ